MIPVREIVVVSLLSLASACSGGDGATGSEGGPCYGNGTCDSTLVCLSNLCVNDTRDSAVDAIVPDGDVGDSGITDSGITDSGITDSGITDSGIDSGTDSGITDSGITDSGITDSGITDSGPAVPCDPVLQTGCGPSEKCTAVFVEPDLAPLTQCAADGTVAEGGACTLDLVATVTGDGGTGDGGTGDGGTGDGGTGDGGTGDGGLPGFASPRVDDCVAGTYCSSGTCIPICDSAAAPAMGCSCAVDSGAFRDRSGVGICLPSCDPIAQDCGVDDGCIPADSAMNTFACATPTSPAGGQEDPCTFSNSCRPGYACILNDAPVFTTLTCAFLCDPAGAINTCADGPGATFTCVRVNQFYSGTDAPDTLGMCIDCAVWDPMGMAYCPPP